VHARRTAELEVLSLHDELTGLLNRRGFHAVAEGQLALARRKDLPGLVLFLDLDGLKTTNDHAGHAAGDLLLCDAARALRTTFRGADTIGRLGGDEFVVFSVASSEPDLAVIIMRLAEEVRKINAGRASALPLVWSIGFLTFDAANGSTLSVMLAEADRRMYEAKQRSRTQPLA
jgi:diguanylate cyclase (GGDEF)-like protein